MVIRAAKKGTRTLILTDRIELFQQSFAAIERAGITPEVLHAKSGHDHITPWTLIILAMVETVSRRIRKGLHLDPQLIIIDEAHKGNFTKILDIFPETRVVGATATPIGKHFHKYYTNLVNNIDIPELVRGNFLVPCRAFQMVADLSDLEVQNGEFTEQSQYKHFSKRILFEGVIEQYIDRIYGQKTLVFNCNIAHAEEMADAFSAAGILSRCITSKTPDEERREILQYYAAGKFPVLNNCGVLTTGFDDPSIECVIMNRATMSLALFLQCLGRASRPFHNKPFFTVLDFGMNHSRHGRWDDEREWTLAEKKKKRMQVAPQKICPTCDALLHASVRECPFCHHQFEFEGLVPQEGVMVEVRKLDSIIPEDLKGKRLSDCTPAELIVLWKAGSIKYALLCRILRTHGEPALREFSRHQKYKKGWLWHQLQDKSATGYKDRVIQ